MNDDALVKLLQLQFEHDQKIDYLEKIGLELDGLRIEVLDIVLDGVGLPHSQNEEYVDNTYVNIERLEAQGKRQTEDGQWFDENGEAIVIVCRDGYHHQRDDMIQNGTKEECQAFIDLVRNDYNEWQAHLKE